MALSVKPTEVKAGRFRFFISYAREDYNIAIAVNNAIQTAAGPAAEVFMTLRCSLASIPRRKSKAGWIRPTFLW